MNHQNHDPADVTLLKIIGEEIPGPAENMVPDPKLSIGANGRPIVKCKKTPFQGFTAFVTRGTAPMAEAGFSTSREYEIQLPLPAAGTVEIWGVSVQYRYKDKPFGQKSPIKEIPVKG